MLIFLFQSREQLRTPAAEYYSPSIVFIYRQIKEAYRKNQWFLLTLKCVPWHDPSVLNPILPTLKFSSLQYHSLYTSMLPKYFDLRPNSRYFLSPQNLLALLLITWKSNSVISLLISVKYLCGKKTINHCAVV